MYIRTYLVGGRGGHGSAYGRHGRGHEHGRGDLVREPLGGERDAAAPVAVPHEHGVLARRQHRHRVGQRVRVLFEGMHLVHVRRVRAAASHVWRRHAVARAAQPCGSLVPAPRTVAQPVHQHEAVLRMGLLVATPLVSMAFDPVVWVALLAQ